MITNIFCSSVIFWCIVLARLFYRLSFSRRDPCWKCLQTAWPTQSSFSGDNRLKVLKTDVTLRLSLGNTVKHCLCDFINYSYFNYLFVSVKSVMLNDNKTETFFINYNQFSSLSYSITWSRLLIIFLNYLFVFETWRWMWV